MKILEVLKFAYGTIMGTSTQYIKPRKRHLFPIQGVELGEGVIGFIGGSCNSVYFVEDHILINPGQGRAAEFIFRELAEKFRVEDILLICTQPDPHFSEGTLLYENPRGIWAPLHLPNEDRAEVVDEGQQGSLRFEIFENAYSKRDLVVSAGDLTLTGGLFYNEIHPPLSHKFTERVDIAKWLHVLQVLSERSGLIIPGEGAICRSQDIEKYCRYLRALSDPNVEFSSCRRDFDWAEIIGTTSLEENFDRLRGGAL